MISPIHKQKKATAAIGRDLSVMVRLLRFPNRVGNTTDQTLLASGGIEHQRREATLTRWRNLRLKPKAAPTPTMGRGAGTDVGVPPA